jgi:hypothetical protein
MIYVIHQGADTSGTCLGTVEAENVYTAAVTASQRFFKEHNYPLRETGWPNTSGVFVTRPREGVAKTFYVRKP